jgi:hypothetical protein
MAGAQAHEGNLIVEADWLGKGARELLHSWFAKSHAPFAYHANCLRLNRDLEHTVHALAEEVISIVDLVQ